MSGTSVAAGVAAGVTAGRATGMGRASSRHDPVGPVVVANRIGGQRVDARAAGGTSFESYNPARPADVVAVLPASDAEAVGAAIDAAVTAQRAWARVPVPARAELIAAAAEVIARR